MVLENLSVGVDIEEISRFEKYASDRNGEFIKKVYTEREAEYCFKSKHPEKHLAARFCAKEAIYKALSSLGFSKISFQDCEIINNEQGAPEVIFLSEKLRNKVRAKISLSHSRTNAIAQVIAEKL
ncbi:holo-ACP synthase [bacterium]|nr:holo-ACP synthase [bacterium]